MKRGLLFLFRYVLFWMSAFVLMRGLFLLYNLTDARQLDAGEVLGAFGNGLRLDLSVAAWALALPCALMAFAALFNAFKVVRIVIGAYTCLLLAAAGIIAVADAVVYGFWSFRLDITPLVYLDHPSEAFASMTMSDLVRDVLVALGVAAVFIAVYFRGVAPSSADGPSGRKPLAVLVYLTILGGLFVPIRGGMQQIPINLSSVYFSNKAFANHAAVNALWNIGYSSMHRDSLSRRYRYMSDDEARAEFAALYTGNSDATGVPRLLTPGVRPNVMLFLVESFSAAVVGAAGGETGLTPNLDRLAREGVLFDNLYASGDRTEKGLVAALSGYPNLPNASICSFPDKAVPLPGLIKGFRRMDYRTAFYYGGESAFANMRAYLLGQGVERLVDRKDFSGEAEHTKWGALDHVVLAKLFEDTSADPCGPFFTVVLTLSSHEPYEVPGPAAVPGQDAASKFRNAVVYADQALGQFFDRARAAPWWRNTLFVLVADHGHKQALRSTGPDPRRYRIPMIWIGGALAKGGVRVEAPGSQTDIPLTLLRQLGVTPRGYRFSRDLLSPRGRPFAFYAFNEGFGFVRDPDRDFVVWDHAGGRILRSAGDAAGALRLGKAYLQEASEDFGKR